MEEYYCPAPASLLATGDWVACGRLVDADGQWCRECQGRANQHLIDLTVARRGWRATLAEVWRRWRRR